MIADAIERPEQFSNFVRDRMRDSKRFQARREFRQNRKG